MACKSSKSSLRTHISFFERVAAEIVKLMWQKMVVVNQMLGAYQLAAPGFYAALIHLAAALYGGCGSSPDLSSLSEMLVHLIVDLLTPNFGLLLAPKLKELQTAEIPESIVRGLTSHTL
jgi:hypothetical protein